MKLSVKTAKRLCVLFWLLFTIELIAHFPATPPMIVLAITSFLLIGHVVYATTFAINLATKLGNLTIGLMLLGGAIILLIPWQDSPLKQGLLYEALFATALAFHFHLGKFAPSNKMSRLTRYKIKLEIGIMVAVALGLLLFKLFPTHTLEIAVLALVGLAISNLVIFFVHGLYAGLV